MKKGDVLRICYKEYKKLFNELYPRPNFDQYKGCLGKVCVVGGSDLYTGAPYYTAMSAIKLGADLSYVICPKTASFVIKSYSPDLIVVPYLDDDDKNEEIMSIIDKCHSLVIGPGLGKDVANMGILNKIITKSLSCNKFLVLDADILWTITTNDSILALLQNKDNNGMVSSNVVLTPNKIEYLRLLNRFNLVESDTNCISELSRSIGACVILKGYHDTFSDGKHIYDLTAINELCPKRCGGQGDILAGFLSVCFLWAFNFEYRNTNVKHTLRAGILATNITKNLATLSFNSNGIGMTATDMINDIPAVINSLKTNVE